MKLEDCLKPCPSDCIFLEWSDWTDCYAQLDKPLRSSSNGIQHRWRLVFVPNSIAPNCSDILKNAFKRKASNNSESSWLEEIILQTDELNQMVHLQRRKCKQGRHYEFQWKFSLWHHGKRQIYCVRNDGIIVESKITYFTWVSKCLHKLTIYIYSKNEVDRFKNEHLYAI